METKKGNGTLHVRIELPKTDRSATQAEIKAGLTAFFELLLEIDQQNNITKEYQDGEQPD